MREKIIKTFDNTNIYYKIKKFKNKKPSLFFVHGLSGNHTVWKKSTEFFSARKYTVVALDLHGHGYSYKSRNASRYKIKHFARDIKTIIDHEKLQNVVLVGISLGGMAILTYENEFGHGTEKLVLMGTTPSNPLKYGQLHYLSEVLTPLYHLFAHTIAYIGSKFNQRKWPYLDYSEFGHHNALTIVYHDLKASPFYSYFWSVVSMFKYDISDSLHTITKPTLLLVGGKDFVVSPKASYDMAKLLLKGKVKTITEADHLIPMRFPNEMNKLILEFITSKKK